MAPIDPYADPATGTLYNRLGATTPEELDKVERRAVYARLLELEQQPIEGNFDAEHFRAIHRHLFQDVYKWAGELRLTDMSRADTPRPFTRSVDVGYELQSRLLELSDDDYLTGLTRPEFATKAAELLRDLNTIHAFAEGNGRTQRAFVGQLAREAGYPLDWGIERPDAIESREEAFNFASRRAHLSGGVALLADYIAASYDLPISPIRRVAYTDADRATVQEEVASAIEEDARPFFDSYTADPRSLDGRYICSDLFKEQFPQFAASPEARGRYNNPVHNSAAVLAAAQLDRILARPAEPERDMVIFLTGVPGAGKTTAVMEGGTLQSKARAVYEGQLANSQQAIEKIQAVFDAGLRPHIMAVHTSPELALQNSLSRFAREGRGASIHAMATIQSQLPAGLTAIYEHFGERVTLDVIDRSAGLNNTVRQSGWDRLSVLNKEGSYDAIYERLSTALEQHHDAGTISEDAYRQARGETTREPSPGTGRQVGDRAQQLRPEGLREPEPNGQAFGALRFWQEKADGKTVKHAAGRLNPPGTEPFSRNLGAQRAISRGTGYDAGHLIGHQFGGPEIPGNLSLQNHLMNQGGGTYYAQEQRWAESLTQGNAVAVHITEHTKDDDATFFYRRVDAITTTPQGEVSHEYFLFANPESERSRQAEGRILTPNPNPPAVQSLPVRPSQPEARITVRLTDEQTKLLLAEKHPQDQREQKRELLDALALKANIAAFGEKAEIGYDPDRETFYALIPADRKQDLDRHLSELSQRQTLRRADRGQERDQDRDRD